MKMKKENFAPMIASILIFGFIAGCSPTKTTQKISPAITPTQIYYGAALATFSGDKPEVFSIEKPEGPALVHMVYTGPDSFVVRAYDKNGEETSYPHPLADEVDSFEGYRLIDNEGTQTVKIAVEYASGPYTIELFPITNQYPVTLTAPGIIQSNIPNLYKISGFTPDVAKMKHEGEYNFIVQILDKNLQNPVWISIASEIGKFEGEKALPEGVVYIYVEMASGLYTIEITGK
jgi:hypothetical protein